MSNIVVWFSCGAASAMAAKLIVEKYGKTDDVKIVYNPVIEEHPDNMRFLKDVEKWLNKKIIIHGNPDYPSNSAVDVWNDRKFMSSPYGAPCTVELKKKARQDFERKNAIDYHVLGFTYDEMNRHERFILTERNNVIPILIDEKMTKFDCLRVVSENVRLPEIYSMGFPNANCIGCVKASSPTYWNLVREKFPEIYKSRSEQSRKINSKLVVIKGKRIFLDELDENTLGRPLKNYSVDCGIFCEEKPFDEVLDRALTIAQEAKQNGQFIPKHLLKMLGESDV
jgi:hypothetical protein